MKKKMTQLIGILVSIILMLSLITACEGDAGTTGMDESTGIENKEGGTEQAGEEKPKFDPNKKISVLIRDKDQYPRVWEEDGTYEENRFVEWIRQSSGINVQFDAIPRANFLQVLRTRLMSDDVPDILRAGSRESLENDFVKQEVVLPLDEIIEKYSTDYKAYMVEHPELDPQLTINGVRYGMATYAPREWKPQEGIHIRKDWLDKFGMDIPKTLDELYDFAYKCTYEDPDGNEIDDTYGFSFSSLNYYVECVENLFQAFSSYWYIEGDTVVPGFICERFKDALSYMNRAYENGLIDPEFYTDTQGNRSKTFWNNGKAGVYFAYWSPGGGYETVMQNVPEADIELIPAPATKYGNNGYIPEGDFCWQLCLSKNTKNPEYVMEYLDWLVREGWETLTFGFEGEHYNVVDGKKVFTPEFNDEISGDLMIEYLSLWPWEQDTETMKAMLPETEGIYKIIAEKKMKALDDVLKYECRRDLPFVPVNNEVLDVLNRMGTQTDLQQSQAILGDKSVEDAYNKVISLWEKFGGKEAEKYVLRFYEENIKK